MIATPQPATGFELRFESLFNAGRALAFPCDPRGRVEIDALSERARLNYYYARAVVGREFAVPAVVCPQRRAQTSADGC
ncbi:MAG: hypothetical protein KGI90_00385 [Burkholderiales bacterium]|nr:hypothetical protein [Burkholderiales bacterium]MDE2276240.1 hypothetical protein [Burkholderiales bacterium]